MKALNFKYSVTILLCILFSIPSINAQTLIYDVSIEDQIQASTQIVEGKVISKQSFWDDNHQNIYTSHIVEVYKVFKGQSISTIEIITKGGVVGLQAEVVSNSLRLHNNDIGVFILSNGYVNSVLSETNISFSVVSAQQGFYKYNFDSDKAINSNKVIDGITTNLYSNIISETKAQTIEVRPFNVSQEINRVSTLNRSSSSAPSISSLSASSNSAGTQSVLTITGSNFGASQGSIGFSDADFGGALFTNALDSQIISWSDTQVEVQIPDFAGTGRVRVNTTINGSINSTENVTIDFAQINLPFNLGTGEIAYQTQHIDNNGEGGNTWVMNDDFFNSDAKDAFERAFNNWTCQSGINWKISSNTTNNSSVADDNVNIITLNSLSAGLLGQCVSRYSGCVSGTEIQWHVEELDIVFNSNINWNFTENTPLNTEIDFESVAIHELGHGQQLGHVIDQDQIMHFSLGGGIAQRDLSTEDLDGATDVMDRSTTNSICGQTVMTFSDCFTSNATLSTNDFDISSEFAMYPNPAVDQVFIKNNSRVIVDDLKLYNLQGQLVKSFKYGNTSTKEIDISNLSQGLYFVNLNTDLGEVTYKLMVR